MLLEGDVSLLLLLPSSLAGWLGQVVACGGYTHGVVIDMHEGQRAPTKGFALVTIRCIVFARTQNDKSGTRLTLV